MLRLDMRCIYFGYSSFNFRWHLGFSFYFVYMVLHSGGFILNEEKIDIVCRSYLSALQGLSTWLDPVAGAALAMVPLSYVGKSIARVPRKVSARTRKR